MQSRSGINAGVGHTEPRLRPANMRAISPLTPRDGGSYRVVSLIPCDRVVSPWAPPLYNPIGMVLIHAETLTDTWRRWPREKSAKEFLSGSGLSVCEVESAFDPPDANQRYPPPCQPALPHD